MQAQTSCKDCDEQRTRHAHTGERDFELRANRATFNRNRACCIAQSAPCPLLARRQGLALIAERHRTRLSGVSSHFPTRAMSAHLSDRWVRCQSAVYRGFDLLIPNSAALSEQGLLRRGGGPWPAVNYPN